jgi:beta-galactosidase
VRLELNGKVIGTKEVSEKTKLTATFEVPYQPGELVATGLTGGKEEVRQVLKTTGKPYRLKVVAEKDSLSLSGDDLAYFSVEILDENGLLVPDASLPVEFEITGGKLQAVANSNPADMHSFQQPKVNTYRGKCQVIIRLEKPGEIFVLAKAEDLKPGDVKIKTE